MQALNWPKYSEIGLALVRIVVGIVFFVHGWQKLFMFGFEGTAGFLGSIGVPAPLVMAVVVTLVELLGGLALIVGLFTRLAAIPIAVTMLVALFTVHLANGFFVSNGGYEFVLTLFVANVSLALAGGGAFAVDNMLLDRPKSTNRRVVTAS